VEKDAISPSGRTLDTCTANHPRRRPPMSWEGGGGGRQAAPGRWGGAGRRAVSQGGGVGVDVADAILQLPLDIFVECHSRSLVIAARARPCARGRKWLDEGRGVWKATSEDVFFATITTRNLSQRCPPPMHKLRMMLTSLPGE
jgi:hypothetical protein